MPDFETSRGAARAPEATGGPFLSFDLAEQVRELRQESYWQSGRNSKTLVKYDDFRIALTAIEAKPRSMNTIWPGASACRQSKAICGCTPEATSSTSRPAAASCWIAPCRTTSLRSRTARFS